MMLSRSAGNRLGFNKDNSHGFTLLVLGPYGANTFIVNFLFSTMLSFYFMIGLVLVSLVSYVPMQNLKHFLIIHFCTCYLFGLILELLSNSYKWRYFDMSFNELKSYHSMQMLYFQIKNNFLSKLTTQKIILISAKIPYLFKRIFHLVLSYILKVRPYYLFTTYVSSLSDPTYLHNSFISYLADRTLHTPSLGDLTYTRQMTPIIPILFSVYLTNMCEQISHKVSNENAMKIAILKYFKIIIYNSIPLIIKSNYRSKQISYRRRSG